MTASTRADTPPAVSVLLPVRDALPTLDAALDSLAAQTLADYEIVAVDDGSRDGSAERLAERARQEPRLRVLHTGGAGLVAALNLGLAQARAPLVARFDADDLAHPRRLALQAARLRAEPGLDALGCRVELFGDGDCAAGNAGMRRYVAWLNALVDHDAILRDIYVESPLAHPSVVLRAARLRALGGWRAFDGPEDYDLWLRAARAGWRFGKLPQVLLRWRDSAARLTRRDPRYAPERFRALKIEALEAAPLVARRPVVVWGGGPIAKGWLRALRERGHDVAALVDVAPRRVGGRVGGVPVVSLEAVPRLAGALHLAAVGQPGARQRIRALAASLGLSDGCDLIAVA
jgi:glycosyltransferase involved in cell wall biosynthesis